MFLLNMRGEYTFCKGDKLTLIAFEIALLVYQGHVFLEVKGSSKFFTAKSTIYPFLAVNIFYMFLQVQN